MIDLIPDFIAERKKFEKVLICGMGGSGISGEILSVLYPKIHIISNRDYTIPEYCNKKTLAILISYSGNTEETLNNYRLLARRKTKMVTISSNGILLKKKSLFKIAVPQRLPPRGALGYLFTPLPIILYKFGFIRRSPKKDLMTLAMFLKKQRNNIEKQAKSLSKHFTNRLPIIYFNSPLFSPVANRWQCQLNENAKTLAHINVIPEMNHNEIVGLGRPQTISKHLLLIFLNDPKAHSRNKIRVRILKEIIKKNVANLIEVSPTGSNNLQRLFWTIMLGDFISYYCATRNGIDPMSVKKIEYLKKRLSEYT